MALVPVAHYRNMLLGDGLCKEGQARRPVFGKFNNRSSHDRFLRAFEVYLAAVQEKKQCP